VRLGARGTLHRVEVDTSHFKGNAPGSCSIEGRDGDQDWKEILPLTPLRPHTLHRLDEVAAAGPVTHARLNIFPDGGVARLRLFGTVSPLDRLSAAVIEDVESELLACCGSRAWARRMAESRPFQSAADLKETSDRIWRSLGREDWLEAFAAHPRIGEKGSRWSQQEQAGALGSAVKTFVALAVANREYESRFDHIFIVCATGKSAEEMLDLLRARLDNDPETELRVAAEEQRKITHLRLEKLLA
jgi:allantoicase